MNTPDRFWPGLERLGNLTRRSTAGALLLLATAFQMPPVALAQSPSAADALRQLTLEELGNIEVTLVSRRPERLTETASAIQVITHEDIRRSGATSLPEALRLVSNLHVARIDASNWAVSARGFNIALANKLLVMIDGRTVYSPQFAGVFWDMQDVLLEDVDRIEVISGPGATLWGTNAVNGVINVVTRSAAETQGLLLAGGGGLDPQGVLALRYGAAPAANVQVRASGKYLNHDNTVFPDGRDASNNWRVSRGGLRVDWQKSANDLLSLQGDLYGGRLATAGPDDTTTSGGNLMLHWTHTISDDADLRVQVYFDRASRKIPGQYEDSLDIYDVDVQHGLLLGERHDVVWGGGYRLVDDDVRNTPAFALFPSRLSQQWFSGFVQDEIALVKDRLHVTLGTKIERNDYTGVEFQPGARVAWRPTVRQTAWASISRAVRTPARIDRDLFVPDAAPFTIVGNDEFISETLIAYELGYRVQPHARLSLALATYYNDYDHLRTFDQVSPPLPIPITVGNGNTAVAYGAELTAEYRVTDWWKLWGGYTGMRNDIRTRPGRTDPALAVVESNDPSHQVSARSSFDVLRQFEVDAMLRSVSRLVNQQVPGYSELNVRVAWHPHPQLELAVVGQNLLHGRHAEFNDPLARQDIERSAGARFSYSF